MRVRINVKNCGRTNLMMACSKLPGKTALVLMDGVHGKSKILDDMRYGWCDFNDTSMHKIFNSVLLLEAHCSGNGPFDNVVIVGTPEFKLTTEPPFTHNLLVFSEVFVDSYGAMAAGSMSVEVRDAAKATREEYLKKTFSINATGSKRCLAVFDSETASGDLWDRYSSTWAEKVLLRGKNMLLPGARVLRNLTKVGCNDYTLVAMEEPNRGIADAIKDMHCWKTALVQIEFISTT